ncbi:PT domain-containing protein [Terrabacter sp. NPDC000476]|uniref:sunset domain-containing protein n=1 Tax=Terrabacter sp. NPDC000476 TaxID=3154258 RepID=UPI003327D00F
MSDTGKTVLWIAVAVVVVVVVVWWFVAAGRRREHEARRFEAGELRASADERRAEVRSREDRASVTGEMAAEARAEAERKAAEARRLEDQARRDREAATAAAAEQQRLAREADRIDPDVRTDEQGRRLDAPATHEPLGADEDKDDDLADAVNPFAPPADLAADESVDGTREAPVGTERTTAASTGTGTDTETASEGTPAMAQSTPSTEGQDAAEATEQPTDQPTGQVAAPTDEPAAAPADEPKSSAATQDATPEPTEVAAPDRSGDTASDDTASDETASDDTASVDTSDDAASGDTASGDGPAPAAQEVDVPALADADDVVVAGGTPDNDPGDHRGQPWATTPGQPGLDDGDEPADEGVDVDMAPHSHASDETDEVAEAVGDDAAGDRVPDDDADGTGADAGAQAGSRRVSEFDEVVDGGFGLGSAAPIHDGAQPLGHAVKGRREAMTFTGPGDEGYDDAEPDVWFYNEEAARRAGFHRDGE